MGESRKTVISLDLGLYHPAKQLQMYRNDLKKLILRVGEMYVEMAMHRTIGAYIEDSGINNCWEESDVFGAGAVHTILEGKHVKRGVCAHLVTFQSLLALYSEIFFVQNKEIYLTCSKAADKVSLACSTGDKDEIRNAFSQMKHEFESCKLHNRMQAFDTKNSDRPMFLFARQFMEMVLEMITFLKSVRNADWELHLSSLNSFTKYFFALDKYVYARLVPIYIADMQQLQISDPDIYSQFMSGNWVVNKNPDVPFCCIGADHGLEHVNRMMKVSGGLVGITLSASARNRFFLVAPHLALLAEQAELLVDSNPLLTKAHHESGATFQQKREDEVFALTETISQFGNPFDDDGSVLLNIVTKKVLPKDAQEDLVNCATIGERLHKTFVVERIESSTVNFWSRMIMTKLKRWKSNNKTVTLPHLISVHENNKRTWAFIR